MASIRVAFAATALLGMAGVCAGAASAADMAIDGQAKVGATTRPVQFVFTCTRNGGPNMTGSLSVEMLIPGYQNLTQAFPFGAFEGPSAPTTKSVRLESRGSVGINDGTFVPAGWIGVESGNPFHLSVAGFSRNDAQKFRALAKVLNPLTTGPSELVWEQANPTPGAPKLFASVSSIGESPARLTNLLGPCLKAAEERR